MNRLAPFLILIVCGLAAMWPVVTARFVLWDDPSTLWQNAAVVQPSADEFLEAWTSAPDAIYMPLTRTLWILLSNVASQPADWMGSSLHPRVYHLANLVIHLVASCLVYRLLIQLSVAATPALLGALLFAVHPVQVEAVAWASGLKDVLSGTLAIASIWCYVEASKAIGNTSKRWFIGCVIAFVLAVLAKPTALVVPVLLLPIGAIALGKPWRAVWPRLIPLLLIAFVAGLGARLIQPALVTPAVEPHLRPLIALDALAFYFRQVIWPWRLAIDYGRTPRFVLDSTMIWISLVVVLAVAAAATAAWRRGWRLEVLGLLLFVLALSPMLGWTRFEFQYYSTVADHYAYVALIGIAMLVASLISRAEHRLFVGLPAVMLLAFAVRAHLQARHWHDTESLARHTLAVNPRSSAAHEMLASYRELRATWLVQQGDPASARAASLEALQHYDAALAIHPAAVRSLDAAATLCWRMHRSAGAAGSAEFEGRAMVYWQRLDALVPSMPPPLQGNFRELPSRLGKISLDLGLDTAAVDYFRRAVALQPDDENAKAGLAIAMARVIGKATTQPAR